MANEYILNHVPNPGELTSLWWGEIYQLGRRHCVVGTSHCLQKVLRAGSVQLGLIDPLASQRFSGSDHVASGALSPDPRFMRIACDALGVMKSVSAPSAHAGFTHFCDWVHLCSASEVVGFWFAKLLARGFDERARQIGELSHVK